MPLTVGSWSFAGLNGRSYGYVESEREYVEEYVEEYVNKAFVVR